MVMGMCSCSEQGSQVWLDDTTSSVQTERQTSPAPEQPANNAAASTEQFKFVSNIDSEPLDKDFVNGLNSFSVELFKTSVKDDLSNGKNTLVSPESVAFALGMTQNGADKNTLKQMQDVLCKGVSQDTFNKNMNRIMSRVEKFNNDKSKLSIADSVWVKDRQDIVPTEQFTKTCKEMYNAELFKGAFDGETVKQINSWVYDKTDKMIPSIVDELDPNDVMILVNCVAFDSKWEKQYEDDQIIENEKFTNAKGDKVECTMLSSTEKCYLSNDRATGFTKSYAGGKYEFMAVLPNEDISISDFVSSMTADEWTKLYDSRSYNYEVIAAIPQFKYDHDLRLKDSLQSLGMTDAFSRSSADFSKMFEATDAYIAQVFHKTHIELDAKGTKAAAATAVEMRAKGEAVSRTERKQVILDRPFAYAIMDSSTGLPVFMGTVCDPTAE